MKPREYQWETETPEGRKVRVTASIWGVDRPGYFNPYDGGSPPEYRDVEITVERSFCPSTPDECGGCEWEDITEQGEPAQSHRSMNTAEQKVWDDWLDTLRDRACELDDDKMQADYEDACERRYDERREGD